MSTLELTRREALAVFGGGLSTGAILPAQPRGGSLAEGFAQPPDSAKPWVFWFWLNGNLTKEGITGDLEAMKRAGIGGVLIMSIAGGVKPGPVEFMSAEWRDIFRHVVAEADRLGIEVDMNNDDGWDCGGPWIKPEHAMQKMVWTETQVAGPQKLSLSLPQPQAILDYYRDVCVLAFPTPAGEDVQHGATSVAVPGQTPYLELALSATVTVRSITVTIVKNRRGKPAFCTLLASDDARDFRPVAKFETGWQYMMSEYPVTVGFDAARGRVFRLLLHGADPKAFSPADLAFRLSGAQRVPYWELKAGHGNVREHGGGAHLFQLPDEVPAADPQAAIPGAAVIDLTRQSNSGRLEWDAPAGKWTILRIGHTCTGRTNGAATAKGKGLDVDKLSRAGVDAHYEGMMAKLIADVKPFLGKSLKSFHNDSWESGCQNWTSGFEVEFRKRRGYDLLPYLPVMAGGRVVESRDVSERFLWDLRRTISDLIREVYWGRLREICREHGLKLSVEAAGRQQFLYDPVNLLSQGDMPMGEFWVGEEWTRPDCKLAASVAHITGGNIAGAESFTSNYPCGNPAAGWWQDSPFSLKARGDHAFCVGINRIVFHRFLHQPGSVHGPGMTWPGVGTNIDRTQTWWESGGAAWMRYISRCQYLLQQGRFVGDICVLTGEGAPNAIARRTKNGPGRPEGQDASTVTEAALIRLGAMPDVPPGYDFDACSADTIAHMRVANGRLSLPSGMSYAVLVLPATRRMTPELMRKLKALVEAGATVAGPKPSASPSMVDQPNADAEVRRLADEVWADCDGRTVTTHNYGKGRVLWGKPLAEVLPAPDFVYTSARADALLDYIHRSDGDTEIYFVSNQRQRVEEVECTFRVSGKKAQLWDADTGQVQDVAAFREVNGRTVVQLRLDPAGSVFVIFGARAASHPVVEAAKVAALPVNGPWRVEFPPGWGAPRAIVLRKLISWTEHPDDGVRHFSGTATYTAEADVAEELFTKGRGWYLDLGSVKEIAEIAINGNRAGVLWKLPFRADVSRWLKPGRNRIEVRVTNLWPNRLIGDAALPADRRIASVIWNPYTPKSVLFESGLLGPVVLVPGTIA